MNNGSPIRGPEGDTEGITEQRVNTWFTNRRKGLSTPSPTRGIQCNLRTRDTLWDRRFPCRAVVPISGVKSLKRYIVKQMSFVEKLSLSQRVPYRILHYS